jgi:hypothetical protein
VVTLLRASKKASGGSDFCDTEMECDSGCESECGFGKEDSGVKSATFTDVGTLRSQCTGASLLVLYVFLLVASRVLLGCFPCEEFDNGSHMLKAGYSISCESSTRNGMAVYSSVMALVWHVGVPLLFALIFIKNRQTIRGDANCG